jgi:hypothetical protein
MQIYIYIYLYIFVYIHIYIHIYNNTPPLLHLIDNTIAAVHPLGGYPIKTHLSLLLGGMEGNYDNMLLYAL